MRGIIIGIPISLLMWAAIIYGVMCATAKAADELEYLAMMNVDRAVCGLHVPQITVDRYISGAAIKYNASQEAVINEAVQLSTIMRDHLRDSGRLKEYCQRRAQK
jgi:flagellar basal body-associated protein FliL